MKNKNKEKYSIKVINDSEVLSQKELVNVLGGINATDSETECTCDCWCGNKNETKKEGLSKA